MEQVSSLASKQISSRIVLIEEYFTTTKCLNLFLCRPTSTVYPVNYSAGNHLKLRLKLGDGYLESNWDSKFDDKRDSLPIIISIIGIIR